jgi:hypothetical protein
MLQLRMVLAMITKRFEMSVSPEQEDAFQHFSDDQADCFSVHLQPLPLILQKRLML